MAGRFGRRMRRGVTGTAVAAAAMAALTASQAPGIAISAPAPDEVTPPPGTPISGGSPYYTELPPLVTPDKPGTSVELPNGPGSVGPGGAGIPATVLAAYKKAEAALARSHPGCHLPWQLLAAIGQVESGQARGGNVDADGTTLSPILGPQLNGVGFANISDTDNGAYDGDSTHDRAVGPMQFIPSTWATWGSDGNGDGKDDPNNVYDATLAAGRYLCAGGRDLSNARDLDRAILGYNHSQEYLRTVRSWFEYFKTGHRAVPDNPTGTGGGSDSPSGTPKPGPTGSAGSDDPSAKPSPSGGKPGGPSTSGKPSPRPTASASGTVRPIPSPSNPGSQSPDPTPSCPTGSPSPSPSDSESGTPTPTPTPTPSETESGTPSPSPSEPDDDPCASPSPSPSASGGPEASPGATPAPKP